MRRKNRKMKKGLKALLMSATLISAAMGFAGCGNETQQQQVTEQVETTKENKVENTIEFKSQGEPVKDDSILGENTYVFSPEDDKDEIQEKVSQVFARQESNQFGDERYALLFKPGDYGNSLEINVGFYTQVSGLGILPTDTNLNKLWVNADWMSHNATCNFWRSAENFSVNDYCMWANSQAVSLRRVNFNDGIVLSDGEGWSSGGFMSDCNVDKLVSSGSQQQYLFRNNNWGYFENGVWNMVFAGVNVDTIPTGGWPYEPYTKEETVPKIQEKPYLAYDEENGYGVVVPEIRTDCQGISWDNGVKGTFYSLNMFYVADPKKDTADTINKALKEGKNLLLTPGMYNLDSPIVIEEKDTIVYGMGLATLVSNNGNVCMETSDTDGIKVCGILFEAGDKQSETLLKVGKEKTDVSHSENPICFSDVYFRVGGAGYKGKVKNCVTINSNDVIGDNFWVWRADHGDNVGWDVNKASNGIVINGDNAIMYGLFVEHFQEYQTIWNGNGGKLYFYQSEMPYDAPGQNAYMSHNGKVKGYASFKIGDDVETFEGVGLGIYCYNRDADIEIFSAAEIPEREGVSIRNIVTVKLNGRGQITHVINNNGDAVTSAGDTSRIKNFEKVEKEDY